MAERFAVALSFPGDSRPFVAELANELAKALTRERVFYDRFHEAELARPYLDSYLQRIYHSDSELVVVVRSGAYDESDWCGLEFKAIRALERRRRDGQIMFLRVGDDDVRGLFGKDGYVDVEDRPASEIAALILERLASIPSKETIASQPNSDVVAGSIRPAFSVIDAATQPPPHRALLRDLERSLGSGELTDSELGPLVLRTLQEEPALQLVKPFDFEWITTGIRVADSYFRLVRLSAGMRDWQRDFAQTATPILVGVARSLLRSPDAQAAVVRLCEAVAQRLRLKLVWPDDPDDLNDLRNDLYRACIDAQEIESDSVLSVLKGLPVAGPS